jgi:hypothetical protein
MSGGCRGVPVSALASVSEHNGGHDNDPIDDKVELTVAPATAAAGVT